MTLDQETTVESPFWVISATMLGSTRTPVPTTVAALPRAVETGTG